jgi:N-acetyl-gamma-glutamyl-phosphate reductase
MVKVGIFGATGYTGFELLKIFARHPEVELVFCLLGDVCRARLL